MQNKLLTIAIPVYNMEKYLNRCIDSLLISSILPFLDIIIVNDGSTDNSEEIINKYVSEFKDTISAIHKTNGNYGSAINVALAKAIGKYFKILDSDDWYDSDGLVEFINNMKQIDVDLIVTNYSEVYANNRPTKYIKSENVEFGKILDLNSSGFNAADFYSNIGMHRVAYKTSLLKEMNLSLQEGISYTDNEYAYYPFEHIHSALFLNLNLYVYYIGREGQTISKDSMIKNSNNLLQIIKRMLDQYSLDLPDKVLDFKRKYLTTTLSTYYHIILVLQKKNTERDITLKNLDSLVKEKDVEIYNMLNKTTTGGIPYIKLWRKFHIYAVPSFVYKMAKKLES